MSKLKLWKPFSLFMVLLLMSSLVAVVPAPVRANLSSITVNPYDTRIIGLNTGYRITMTTGATLSAGDNITIEFPADTGGLGGVLVPGSKNFVNDSGAFVSLDGQKVTVTIPNIAPIVPGQQFTVTFRKDCGITNPATSGSRTVTVWTTVEPAHVISSSYEITAVKVYTGATKHSENATIQAAIDAAISGDTITVPAGTFTENLNVDKSLILQGASSATVIVTAADPAVSVFNVTASSVKISGFTVTGANVSTTAGIYLGNDVANCNIHDNILTGNGDGIWLGAGSNHNILTNNTLSSNYQGFEVYISNYNTFTNNIANSNTKYGFKIDSGDHNTFTNNTANSNGDKGFYSVEGDGGGSTNSAFTNNTANYNTRHGLHLIGSNDHVTLTGNTFAGNLQTGMKLQNVVTNLTLDGNSISGNPTGIYISNENSPNIPDVTTWAVNHNNITGNANYGINNAGTGTLNAKHNYWGNASGPSHDSPVTYGDKVSANVNFQPWLIAAYSGTPPASDITISTTSPHILGRFIPEQYQPGSVLAAATCQVTQRYIVLAHLVLP
jgi:parallel beta-helix repeat protein